MIGKLVNINRRLCWAVIDRLDRLSLLQSIDKRPVPYFSIHPVIRDWLQLRKKKRYERKEKLRSAIQLVVVAVGSMASDSSTWLFWSIEQVSTQKYCRPSWILQKSSFRTAGFFSVSAVFNVLKFDLIIRLRAPGVGLAKGGAFSTEKDSGLKLPSLLILKRRISG